MERNGLYKEMHVRGEKASEEFFQKFHLSTENWGVNAEEEQRCKKAFSLGWWFYLLENEMEFLDVLLEAIENVNGAIKAREVAVTEEQEENNNFRQRKE